MCDRYDGVFRVQGEVLGHDWRLFKAMAKTESNFRPNAVSGCGALGLMQVMPATARDLGVVDSSLLLNPTINIALGSLYFSIQYKYLPEVRDHESRIKCALASYNGGRGYINKAIKLHLDREQRHVYTWDAVTKYLADPQCTVGGRRPDHKQITAYVGKVWTAYAAYSTAQGDAS